MKSSQRNDSLLFYYSGHGDQKIENNNDEENIKNIYKCQGLLINASLKLVMDLFTYFQHAKTYVVSFN